MSRIRVARLVGAVAAAAVVSGACHGTTRMVETWRDPGVAPAPLTRTLAVFMSSDAGTRRLVEDRMAGRLPGAIPSYRVIPDESVSNVDSVRAYVAGGNFDGAVMMRLVNVTTEVVDTPAYPGFYDYWGYWRSAYHPYAYSVDRIYSVETTVHSLRDGRMVWMGRSETVDPKNVGRLADRSARAVYKSLRKAGYIQ